MSGGEGRDGESTGTTGTGGASGATGTASGKTASENTASEKTTSGKMASAGASGKMASAGSSGKTTSAGSSGKMASAGASGKMASAGASGKMASAGSSDKMASAGAGSRGPSSSGSMPMPRPRGGMAPPPEPLGRRLLEGLREAAVTNLGLKLLSLILSLTVFLLVNSDRDREITLHVGVSYTLPEDKVLVSERLPEMRVTVRGPWRQLRRFDERELDRVNLDLTRVSGGEVPITNDMVRVPSGITVVSISPRSFRVAFEKRVDKTVAVTVPTSGRPLHGFVVTSVVVTPATVAARGAQGVIAALSAIRGRDVRVDGRSDSFELETELLPPDGVELDAGKRAVVRVEIKEELVSRRIGPLPVQLRGDGVDPARLSIKPAQVDVTLTGALLAVEHAITSGITPQLRVAPGQLGEQPVSVETSVPGVGITITPPRVRLTRR
jgi:YbbR-like protein